MLGEMGSQGMFIMFAYLANIFIHISVNHCNKVDGYKRPENVFNTDT